MKSITIDGSKFNDLEGFYKEAYAKLAPNYEGYVRGNLDSFNDILNGGFGAFEDNEKVELIWKESNKSKEDLGYPATINQLEGWAQHSHPDGLTAIQERLDKAKSHQGSTLFDDLVKIIRDHADQIQLILE